MRALKDEFARLKPRLERAGVKDSVEGAYARAMLALIPALIEHLAAEEKRQAAKSQTFEGVGGALANVVYQALRYTFEQPERLGALGAIVGQIYSSVRPLLERTSGGIFLPGGEQ